MHDNCMSLYIILLVWLPAIFSYKSLLSVSRGIRAGNQSILLKSSIITFEFYQKSNLEWHFARLYLFRICQLWIRPSHIDVFYNWSSLLMKFLFKWKKQIKHKVDTGNTSQRNLWKFLYRLPYSLRLSPLQILVRAHILRAYKITTVMLFCISSISKS